MYRNLTVSEREESNYTEGPAVLYFLNTEKKDEIRSRLLRVSKLLTRNNFFEQKLKHLVLPEVITISWRFTRVQKFD